MGKVIQVKKEYSGVQVLAGYRGLSSNEQFTLTDAEYAALPPAVVRAITLITSGVDEPSRVTPAPTSSSSPGAGRNVLTGMWHANGFGAAGDGVADDTTKIQAAINAAPAGAAVLLQSNKYRITAPLVLKTGQRLLGSGTAATTLTQATLNQDAIRGVDLKDVEVSSMTIAGPGRAANPTAGSGINFTLSGTGPNATFYVTMRDLFVTGFGLDGVAVSAPVASRFEKVMAFTNNRHGINLYGGGPVDGTSCALIACYSAGNFGAGIRLFQMAYSSLNGCAADSNGIQYEYATCIGITESGCGSEEPYDFSSHVAGYSGYSRKIFNSRVTLNNPYSIGNIGTAYWVTNGSVVTANVPFEGSPGNTDSPTNNPTNAWLVDSGCKVILNNPVQTTANSLASGTTTVFPDALVGLGGGSSADPNNLTTGEATLKRLQISASTIALGASGSVRFTYFTATKSGTYTQLKAVTGTVAAAATPTLCRMGIYSVAANGNLTLIASTPNDTTLFAATNTAYTKATSASFSLVSGQRYAFAVLVVSAAALPNFLGASMAGSYAATEAALDPRLTGNLNTQSDLPAAPTFDLIGANATAFYAVCL